MSLCDTQSLYGVSYTSFYLLPLTENTPAQRIDLIDDDGLAVNCFIDKPQEIYSGKEVLLANYTYKRTGFRGIRYSFTLNARFVSQDLFSKIIEINNWDGRLYLRPRYDNKKVFLVASNPFDLYDISKWYYTGEALRNYNIDAMELESKYFDWDDSSLVDYDNYIPSNIAIMGSKFSGDNYAILGAKLAANDDYMLR